MDVPELRARDVNPLAFRQWGEGRDVLLVHGWASNGANFAPLAERLAGCGLRIIAPDLRGHGDTPAGAKRLSIALLANDIADIAVGLGLSNAVAVGWSMGAAVLWDALSGPQASRFAGAVFVDMSPRILNDPHWSGGLKGYDRRALQLTQDTMRADWPAFVERFADRVVAPGASPALVASIANAARACDAQALIDLWSDLVERDDREALTRVALPARVAFGAKSQLYGPHVAQFVAGSLPQGAAVEFSRSGHAPHLEEPEAFARLLIEFAETLALAPNQVARGERMPDKTGAQKGGRP